MNIEIKFTCDKCDKSFDEIDSNVYCDNCDNNNNDEYAYNTIKNAVKLAYEHKFEWENKEDCIGFKSDEERDIFLSGKKKGYLNALFWVCDFMGDDGIEFFQEMAKEDWK